MRQLIRLGIFQWWQKVAARERRRRTGHPGVFVQGLGKTWPCRETTLSDVWEAAVIFFFSVWIGVVVKGVGGIVGQYPKSMTWVPYVTEDTPLPPLSCSLSLLPFFRTEGEGGISASR